MGLISRVSSRTYRKKLFKSIIMSSGNAAIGKPAPSFTCTSVIDGQFKDISLSDYKGKYVVLFFYPLDFTFVCPTEIIAFSNAKAKFDELNCALLGCSTDSEFSHLAWTNTPTKQGGIGQITYPLIADKNHSIGKDYGVMVEDSGITYRGLFIIDGKQNVRQITI